MRTGIAWVLGAALMASTAHAQSSPAPISPSDWPRYTRDPDGFTG